MTDEEKIAMDRIPEHLKTATEYLTEVNQKLIGLRVSQLIRNRKALSELDEISAQVAAALVKINDLRTMSHPENWRSTARKDGIDVPAKENDVT